MQKIVNEMLAIAFCIFSLNAFGQNITIPDANFKFALVNNWCVDTDGDGSSDADADTDNDGGISVSEALAVNRLRVVNIISNLEGIQYFTNLQTLKCDGNVLTSLNVQSLTNLQRLECGSNQITSLNVQGLTNLQTLYCNDNQLLSLNVQGLTNLQLLECGGNQLPSLNVQGLSNLQTVSCPNNQLPSLNVQGLTNLQLLACGGNQLTSLNLQGLTNLQTLYCQSNQLTNLDAQGLPNLQTLWCQSNQLTSLSIKNGSLETVLNFSTNPNLVYICCDEGQTAAVQNQATQYGYTNCVVNSNCLTSSSSAQNGFDFVVQPNPTTGALRLDTSIRIEKIEVYDNLGHLLQANSLQNQALNIGNLPAGIYFLKAFSKTGVAVQKIVKQ